MKPIKFSNRYVPKLLTRRDKKKQIAMLLKSRRLYKRHKYYTRKKIASYKNKKSNHIANARKIYNIDTILPNKELSLKTGCKISALRQIVKKGQGRIFRLVQDQIKHHDHGG